MNNVFTPWALAERYKSEFLSCASLLHRQSRQFCPPGMDQAARRISPSMRNAAALLTIFLIGNETMRQIADTYCQENRISDLREPARTHSGLVGKPRKALVKIVF